MRQGISITVDAAARARLAAIVADRNRPQKHVWRARIILLTADGVGTSGIERMENLIVARAAYRAACERWPSASIALRQGARVVEDSQRRMKA
jgi:hypothetical protein